MKLILFKIILVAKVQGGSLEADWFYLGKTLLNIGKNKSAD